ncbi:prolyl oligopeptidase family serine peptidase [candidate division KSB1 bacterium]|nr:prolyl oligopeptidase family serine peptidase [candidate division KSB1 bacterium]
MSFTVNATFSTILIAGFLIMLASSSMAQEIEYQMPVKEIADLVDAPRTPYVSLSPDQRWLLILKAPGLPPISEVAQREVRLAGIRLNPDTNGPSRGDYFISMSLKSIQNEKEIPITNLPDDPRIRNISWAPDSRHIAFSLTKENGIELWIADVKSGHARRLLGPCLNAAYYNTPFCWEPGGQSLLCKRIIENRGVLPQAGRIPTGPVVQENIGKTAPAPTWQDLLKNPHDEKLFEYFFSAQLIRLDLQGQTTTLNKEGLIKHVAPSPDGKYILISFIQRPFSYLVPAYRFPYRVEILDEHGKPIKLIADLPLAEEVPIQRDAVPKGPRAFEWRQDADATLYWVEAQDEGDPSQNVPIRDKVWALSAPFDHDAKMMCNLALRFGAIFWADDKVALVTEWWWKTRKERAWLFEPGAPQKQTRLIFDLSMEDQYNDPGTPMMMARPNGSRVLRLGKSGKVIYLRGQGASPKGDFPFLDEYNLYTGNKKRLWQCQAPYYEMVIDFLSQDNNVILSRRESSNEVPNYYIRNIKKNTCKALTDFPHPYPDLAKMTKELIRYPRNDGITLSATLYTPPGYSLLQGPLPVLMWAYPQEFKSADAASQVTDSPYRFLRFNWSSPLFWLVRGYAILDDPAMPIIGEKEKEPNDTYVEQLVASARAAVDELVRRGIADPERIAIGGHSYGAFMVANLLSHSQLFKAGIARSGAYNRTLTPFGFQAEERTIWQAQDTYVKMSPFMCADSLNAPLLLIHGEADNNSGTFPMQSERYYNALKGLGKTTRLVILPHESHGYRARESVMHMLWEMDRWLERWVKAR